MINNDKTFGTVKFVVDCVLLSFHNDQLEVFLVSENRVDNWNFMIGSIDINKPLTEGVKEMLKREVNIDNVSVHQLVTEKSFNHYLNENILKLTYFSLVTKELFNSKLMNSSFGKWFPINDLPYCKDNCLKLINLLIVRLKNQGMFSPIILELLPDKFTIKQLHELYEQIYSKEIDKRNFIRKISALDCMIKLNIKDKIVSRKGAYLYAINWEKLNAEKLLQLKLV
ncbi:NrtR DNA-binding winged helix domain-containing protein [Flavobacterium sp. ARAG 55.4]|uniref:NrtR DNA-binding winged helix domain-containing protein n=1 Tax=Flavobacterium sp. ARAG 55.4 TaxID=3451357 RepID=UPI003F48CB65